MNLPVEIIEAVQQGRCVLFVGSRFTGEAVEAAGRAFPDDRALAASLGWKKARRMMGTVRKKGAAEVPSVVRGASIFEQERGRPALLGTLKLQLGAAGVEPLDAHRIAMSKFKTVFTTNADDLLERADAAAGDPREVRLRGDAIPAAGERVLYKMRGDFANPGSLVLTEADYADAELSVDVRRAMRKLIRGSVVFFVGYKPDEEEFERLWADLTVCYGGELPRCHLAVSQGRINDYLWQKWVWRGLLMFTADPGECMEELERREGD